MQGRRRLVGQAPGDGAEDGGMTNHERILACEHDWATISAGRQEAQLRAAGRERVLCLRCWCEVDRRA